MSDYRSYCPEMGDTAPEDMQIEVSGGARGGWYCRTFLTLKGRGIRLVSDGSNSTTGRRAYLCTELAFQKLRKEYIVVTECIL